MTPVEIPKNRDRRDERDKAKRAVGITPRSLFKCEVEVIERRRQVQRAFSLIYLEECFEAWEKDPGNLEFVAMHARRWITVYLGYIRQAPNLSAALRRTTAHIYW